jgi:stress-induced-phosphoprotein 1
MSNIEEANKAKALGNEAFSAKKYEEAIQHFTRAINLNPNDHVFYSNRSACYASLEDYDKALEDADKCVSLKPDWSKGYTRKGLAEFYLEKYDEAEKTYQKGLELDPTNQQLKEGLERVKESKEQGGASGGFGNQFMQQALGRLLSNPETAKYFEDQEFVQKLTAISKNPQLISLYMNDPKIQKAFQIILAGAGGPFGGAGGAGGFGETGGSEFNSEASHEKHHHEEEVPKTESKKTEEFKFETEKPHSHSHSHSHSEHKPEPSKPKPQSHLSPAEEEKNKGNEEYKRKNFDQAISHYEKAIELDPNESIYYNNLAAVYIEKKDFDKAIECCDKAEEICKSAGHYDYIKLSKILARKANAYTHKGDFQTSLDLYQQSLLENNDYKVKEEMKKVEKMKKEHEEKSYINPEIAEEHRIRGNQFYGEGKYPEAIKEYEEAIKRSPLDAKLYANKGTALMKLMEYPSAMRDINKCLELDPNYVKGYAKKGIIHYYMKEYHKALEAYEKGLKIEPNNEECKSGIEKTRMTIMGSGGTESKEDMNERLSKAMADPEIRAILQDPLTMQLLRDLQEKPGDPNSLAALRDPAVAKKIDKLIAAGILRMG